MADVVALRWSKAAPAVGTLQPKGGLLARFEAREPTCLQNHPMAPPYWRDFRLTGRQIWAGTVRTQLEASQVPSLQAWSSTKPVGKTPTD